MYNVYNMIRTQIYLPEELHYQLKQLARFQTTSVSEIIRKNLTKSIKDDEKSKKKSAYDFFDWLIKEGKKHGKNLPKDLSSKHTEYYLETVVKSK